MPAHVRRRHQPALRHRLKRLERRDKVGQPHMLTRIDQQVDQRIITLDLLVRDAADEMDMRRGGRGRGREGPPRPRPRQGARRREAPRARARGGRRRRHPPRLQGEPARRQLRPRQGRGPRHPRRAQEGPGRSPAGSLPRRLDGLTQLPDLLLQPYKYCSPPWGTRFLLLNLQLLWPHPLIRRLQQNTLNFQVENTKLNTHVETFCCQRDDDSHLVSLLFSVFVLSRLLY